MLSLPPAFALSQDQTLKLNEILISADHTFSLVSLARRHSLTLIVFFLFPLAALVVTYAAHQHREEVDGLCVLARTI